MRKIGFLILVAVLSGCGGPQIYAYKDQMRRVECVNGYCDEVTVYEERHTEVTAPTQIGVDLSVGLGRRPYFYGNVGAYQSGVYQGNYGQGEYQLPGVFTPGMNHPANHPNNFRRW
ncbi:MAG TPA: hypothetical protein DIT25_01270 [Candidatus Moranbacteria bacterium]|nr:hypothetical protein [Candidatus Moranbacteria bacterium]